jgi:hypothetical protein
MSMQRVPPPLLEQDVDGVSIAPLPLDALSFHLGLNPILILLMQLLRIYILLPSVPEPNLAITGATFENIFNGADEMLDAGEALLMFASANEAV